MLRLNIVLCIEIFQNMNYIMQKFEQCIYLYVKKLCVFKTVYIGIIEYPQEVNRFEKGFRVFFGLIIFTILT